MTRLIKVITCVLILLTGVLFSVRMTADLSNRYTAAVDRYPSGVAPLYLKGIPAEKQSRTLAYLEDYCRRRGTLLVRSDLLLDSQGNAIGRKLGVAGSADGHVAALQLDFMGCSVLDARKLDRLLRAEGGAASLGLDLSGVDSLESLPSFRFGDKLVVKKLDRLVQESGTANGVYKVVGLTEADREALAVELAQQAGIAKEKILQAYSGAYTATNLYVKFIGLALPVAYVLLLALLLIYTLLSLKDLGVHLLLGWSRRGYAVRLYRDFVLLSFLNLPLVCGVALYLTRDGFLSFRFLGAALLRGVFSVLGCGAAILLASLLLYTASPVTVIKNGAPKRVALVITLIFYIFANAALGAACPVMDGPLYEVAQNRETLRRWQQVDSLRILRDLSTGEDASSFSHQSTQLAQDFYNWYAAIEHEEGAYLIHTDYYSARILRELKENRVYANVPERPFWRFKASPNYLASVGLEVPEPLRKLAADGTRVYLIPDTYSSAEREVMEKYLRESDLHGLSAADIKTKFSDRHAFRFAAYRPSHALFTWSTQPEQPSAVPDPVILVSCAENMIFMESESLYAIGLQNCYLKLTAPTAGRCLAPTVLTRYHLDDNQLKFVPAHDYVVGLQKQLSETIQLFGGIIVLLSLLVLALIIGLVVAFAYVHEERIAVEQLLGYRLRDIFSLPFAVTGGVSLVMIAVLAAARCRFGRDYFIVLLLVEILALWLYMRSARRRQLNLRLKDR